MPVVPPVDMGLRSPSKYPELEQLRHLNVLYFHWEPLPLDDLPLWITCWKWYEYHGRFLDPDEVLGMMNIYYKLDPLEPRLPSGMIELFDDNTSQMTIALESLKSEHYHVLVGQAGYLFEKLQENHHSKIKAQILLGL